MSKLNIWLDNDLSVHPIIAHQVNLGYLTHIQVQNLKPYQTELLSNQVVHFLLLSEQMTMKELLAMNETSAINLIDNIHRLEGKNKYYSEEMAAGLTHAQYLVQLGIMPHDQYMSLRTTDIQTLSRLEVFEEILKTTNTISCYLTENKTSLNPVKQVNNPYRGITQKEKASISAQAFINHIHGYREKPYMRLENRMIQKTHSQCPQPAAVTTTEIKLAMISHKITQNELDVAQNIDREAHHPNTGNKAQTNLAKGRPALLRDDLVIEMIGERSLTIHMISTCNNPGEMLLALQIIKDELGADKKQDIKTAFRRMMMEDKIVTRLPGYGPKKWTRTAANDANLTTILTADMPRQFKTGQEQLLNIKNKRPTSKNTWD